MAMDFLGSELELQNNSAYIPGLDRIESHSLELADDCTLKFDCERSPQQLNIQGKKPVVAMLN